MEMAVPAASWTAALQAAQDIQFLVEEAQHTLASVTDRENCFDLLKQAGCPTTSPQLPKTMELSTVTKTGVSCPTPRNTSSSTMPRLTANSASSASSLVPLRIAPLQTSRRVMPALIWSMPG
jgi:hypothetical protein